MEKKRKVPALPLGFLFPDQMYACQLPALTYQVMESDFDFAFEGQHENKNPNASFEQQLTMVYQHLQRQKKRGKAKRTDVFWLVIWVFARPVFAQGGA